MSTISKAIPSAICRLHNRPYIRSVRMSSTCGGDDKSKNGDGGDKEPCECPCCSSPSDNTPTTPTPYDCRKYGHCLPANTVMPRFETLPHIPTGIFRCTDGEQRLGSGADKCSCYLCPEYFSYHHMTFYDMHMILRGCRIPSPKTGRKP